MYVLKVFSILGLLLVGCTEHKTLPNVSDASYYQDVLLSFSMDKEDPAWRRLKKITDTKPMLRIGLNIETPPFVMADNDGTWHGFTIDYLRRITELTGQSIEWVPYHQLSVLLKDLNQGKIDVAAGGITDTKNRRHHGFIFVPELRQDELAILTGFAKNTQISKELYGLIIIFFFSLFVYTTLNYRKLKGQDMSWMYRLATAFHETIAVHYSRDAKIPLVTAKDKILDAFQLIKGPAFLSLIITFAVVDYLNADYDIKNLSDLQHKVVSTKSDTNTLQFLQETPLQASELRGAVMLFLQGD
ncbi:MAG: transporter substrate-binding domain-containing protein, partial [Mariprofundaceae bacterium]|nr:transporter substrate-binding domain-containing protein [Mariprofundaceae bacterium]